MIYTPLHGKRKLEGKSLIFLLSTLTPRHVSLMKVSHRDQILLSSPLPVFTFPVVVKTRERAKLLTQIQQLPKILIHKVKSRSLWPLQTNVTLIIHTEYTGQTQTLIPHTNLSKNHYRGTVTPSAIEINDPIAEDNPQVEANFSRVANYHLHPIANPNCSKIYRCWWVPESHTTPKSRWLSIIFQSVFRTFILFFLCLVVYEISKWSELNLSNIFKVFCCLSQILPPVFFEERKLLAKFKAASLRFS